MRHLDWQTSTVHKSVPQSMTPRRPRAAAALRRGVPWASQCASQEGSCIREASESTCARWAPAAVERPATQVERGGEWVVIEHDWLVAASSAQY
jgi:hypothetical protein